MNSLNQFKSINASIFANDIVLIDEIRHGVNVKLKIWWNTLESKFFCLSKTKTDREHRMSD